MADVPPWARTLTRFWEIPFLAALAGFMFWVRMLPYQPLLGQGRAYFIGTDPFYHYRATLGIVRSFPAVPRWDPFTFYPHGTATGQFSSLFDWLAAAVVVMTAGKDAPDAYVATVLGVMPAVLGALLIVPFYFLAKRLLGTPGAVVSCITLALLPGEFLIRSIAGYADHHVAEDFFSVLAILAVVVAVERGHAARMHVTSWRPTRALARPLVFGVLGGLAVAANLYAWPPAILFVGILTLWLTVVVLLENAREDGDARGLVLGAAVSFVVAALLMLPAIETTFLGEFNTYGILQPAFCLLAAAWLAGIHLASRAVRARGLNAWVVPGALAALALVVFVAVRLVAPVTYSSLRWGLGWITGVGASRTTTTIAEARGADYFCGGDTMNSCLSNDFGFVAPATFIILLALAVFALWKRRRADILLLIWSLVIFRATDTQIRFSYYLAINMALLIGWLAARAAEGTGLTRADEETAAPAAPAKGKGRRTRKVEVEARGSLPLQVAAVAAVLLLVLPGNVFATDRSRPAWVTANSIGGADADLVLWLEGLDWMRENTPDAGVDLGAIVERPPVGEKYDYPPNAYGVMSWWDYGHWIESVGRRPPVANPFQQAAPFASLWFTERDAATAERMLDEWVGDSPPIRYVYIDDEMATGKFGAITVWANTNNASRPTWPGGEFATQRGFQVNGRMESLYVTGPGYTESMMGRLYEGDGNGLSHYRLVWEHPEYRVVGNIVAQGEVRCFHDAIPSGGCPFGIDPNAVQQAQPDHVIPLGQDAYLYDVAIASRLKLYERVEGARLVGQAAPDLPVEASAIVVVTHPDGRERAFEHRVSATADAEGNFEIVFPYSTVGFLTPAQGGTTLVAKPEGSVQVSQGGRNVLIDIPDSAVLNGEVVPVAFR